MASVPRSKWTIKNVTRGFLDNADSLVKRRTRELDLAEAEYGALSPQWCAAKDRLLEAVNQAAAARGEIFLRRLTLENRYSPDAPDPLLVQRPASTFLCLRSHPVGTDNRRILLEFDNCYAATFSPPAEDLLGRLQITPAGA